MARRAPDAPVQAALRGKLDAVLAEQDDRAPGSLLMREHDVAALSAAELEAARRELAASLALARPGLPGSPSARSPDGGHAG